MELARKVFGDDLIETHLSVVCFPVESKEFAYKMKKSVCLPFVDQSTLEKRHKLCVEEVKLNARFCDLYLGVVAIDKENKLVEGDAIVESDVVEWLVKMKRFEQSCQGDEALKNGRLTEAHLLGFAATLATQHETLPRADKSMAGTEQQDQLDNCTYLAQCDFVPKDQLRIVHDWIVREGQRLEELIRERRENGFVRSCHGDLHLSNTVLLEESNQLVAFDCLEFNPALRTVDTIADVAFLIMDLDSRNRSDLGMAFLSAYLEHSGDFDGLQLLTYYLVYRTMVRSKVAAIGHNQARCQLHLDLALFYVQSRKNKAVMVLMHGLSGSGKSFVARQLVGPLRALCVRSDVVRKRLFNLRPLDSSGDIVVGGGIYSADATAKVYLRVQEIARFALMQNISIIIDATNTRRQARDAMRALCIEMGAEFTLLSCSASLEVLLRRVNERKLIGQDPSEASEDVLRKQLERAEPVDKSEGAIVIDTSAGLTAKDIASIAEQIQNIHFKRE